MRSFWHLGSSDDKVTINQRRQVVLDRMNRFCRDALALWTKPSGTKALMRGMIALVPRFCNGPGQKSIYPIEDDLSPLVYLGTG